MKTKQIITLICVSVVSFTLSAQNIRKHDYSISINNIFTYPYNENYYGTNVLKVIPKISRGLQLEWRYNRSFNKNISVFTGISLARYRTKFSYIHYKSYSPGHSPILAQHPLLINNFLLSEIPLGISYYFNSAKRINCKINCGLKVATIQSVWSPTYSYIHPNTSNSYDSSYLYFYMDMYSADPYTLFIKYFGEIEINYKLKSNNYFGIGIDYTAPFARKSNPQVSGHSYWFYYEKLRGEGYLRNSGAYLGLKISYIYGHGKKKNATINVTSRESKQ